MCEPLPRMAKARATSPSRAHATFFYIHCLSKPPRAGRWKNPDTPTGSLSREWTVRSHTNEAPHLPPRCTYSRRSAPLRPTQCTSPHWQCTRGTTGRPVHLHPAWIHASDPVGRNFWMDWDWLGRVGRMWPFDTPRCRPWII